jgi:hypothetical protein
MNSFVLALGEHWEGGMTSQAGDVFARGIGLRMLGTTGSQVFSRGGFMRED